MHPGHEFVLTEALKRGELFIIIARDVTVERIKGRLPSQSEAQRMAAVRTFVPDAQVLLGDETDYLKPIRAVRPDLILLGYDQELPPGITPEDLGCAVERLEALHPKRYKSSLRRRHSSARPSGKP